MMRQDLRILAAIAGLLGVACSSDSDVDIGDGRSGQSLKDYAATWLGYVEAYSFEDGSNTLRLVLDDQGAGTLTVGEAPAPQADDAAPPHFWSSDGLAPGFAYSTKWATIEQKRLRFKVQPSEAVDGWCRAQTPVIWRGNSYACRPDGMTGMGGGEAGMPACYLLPKDGPKQYMDCSALSYCAGDGLCECSESGCEVPEKDPEGPEPFGSWDSALEADGDSLVGTFVVGLAYMRLAVRMERQ